MKTIELQRFWTLLNNGTISRQEPDGGDIIASMKRAVVIEDTVEWSETCYCNPPLNHERTTVYDQFFSDIEIQPQTNTTGLTGERFWQYLQQRFVDTQKVGHRGVMSTGLTHIPLRLV